MGGAAQDQDPPLDSRSEPGGGGPRPAEGVVEGAGGVQYGDPLPNYTRGEAGWPVVWRMPEAPDDEDQDLFDKMAWLTDDILLREAVHCWDNCLRLPQAAEGVAGGMISAHARFIVGIGVASDLEKAADAVREAWLGMARQALKVQEAGQW